jgi:hypothetical protein
MLTSQYAAFVRQWRVRPNLTLTWPRYEDWAVPGSMTLANFLIWRGTR